MIACAYYGLSLNQLADAANVNYNSLWKAANNKQNLSMENWIKLVNATSGLPLEFWVTGEMPSKEAPDPIHEECKLQLDELLSNYVGFPVSCEFDTDQAVKYLDETQCGQYASNKWNYDEKRYTEDAS